VCVSVSVPVPVSVTVSVSVSVSVCVSASLFMRLRLCLYERERAREREIRRLPQSTVQQTGARPLSARERPLAVVLSGSRASRWQSCSDCQRAALQKQVLRLVPGSQLPMVTPVSQLLMGPLWEGYRESRRCSRDTYPESYITQYTSIRRKYEPAIGPRIV